MSGNSFLLDTNIVLYLLSGDRTLVEILRGKRIYVSIITEIELLSFKKLSKNERYRIESFLDDIQVIEVNSDVKHEIIDIRKIYGLKLPDCIIAGSAKALQVPLISADKEFKKVERIELLFFEK